MTCLISSAQNTIHATPPPLFSPPFARKSCASMQLLVNLAIFWMPDNICRTLHTFPLQAAGPILVAWPLTQQALLHIFLSADQDHSISFIFWLTCRMSDPASCSILHLPDLTATAHDAWCCMCHLYAASFTFSAFRRLYCLSEAESG